MSTKPLKMVIGCLQDQRPTVKETIPTLMSAAVYADELVVVCREADTLMELNDWYPILDDFQEFMEYQGADSYYSNPIDSETEQGEKLRRAVTEAMADAAEHGVPPEEFVEWAIRNIDPSLWESVPYRGNSNSTSDLQEALSVAKVVESYLESPNVVPLVFDPEGLLKSQAAGLQRLSKPTKVKGEADARLGSGLVDLLPSFEGLQSAEILELRAALKPYLTPFRSFVVETSTALTSVVRDEEAVRDVVHELYIGKVRPVLDEINDQWRHSNAVRSLIRDFGRDPKAFVTSFVTFGLGEVADLPIEVSIGAAAASQVIGAAAQQQTARKTLKGNRLFMLHEVEQYASKAR
ncbi:hypothetical protein [Arthrobacter sp. R4-81]